MRVIRHFSPNSHSSPTRLQVFISLYFGTTEGEGGSFALYQGLYPAAEKDFDADRTLTGESQDLRQRPLSEHSRSFKDRIRLPLLIWVRGASPLSATHWLIENLLAVTLWDSADDGRWCTHSCRVYHECCWRYRCCPAKRIRGRRPHFYRTLFPSSGNEVNLTLSQAFILILFFVQQFGTHRLAITFSPSKLA